MLSPKPSPLFAVVRALEARYHGVTALKATFLERRSEGKRAVEIESGTVYFRKPGRMRWEYESPEKKLFLTDGKYAWFYVPADHTVSRARMKESDDERVPLALLTGNAKLSRICKRIEFAGASTLSGNSPSAINHIALRCFPRSEGAFLDAIIELDASYRIARILLHEPGAIETEFRFADWQENARLSDELFRFAAPPGVAIVEAPSAESLNQ
ncbi:MAG: outer membrane lipoprotein carrier protein LolA [Acidipila sp.]|nr:outer membrane lipoprotein carrier protein LolA [Acidipila sp.]